MSAPAKEVEAVDPALAHLSASSSKARVKTPSAWLSFGSQLGDVVNKYASRDDIVTVVGPDGAKGTGAPACFKPLVAELEINTTIAFGEDLDPKYLGDITQRDIQFENPTLMGLALHEAMHARHTRWDLMVGKDLDPNVYRLMIVFEETRIEARGVHHFKWDRSFLRSSAMNIIINDMMEKDASGEQSFTDQTVMGMSQLILLSLARVDAKVLKKRDVKRIHKAVLSWTDKKTLAKLQDIWQRAQRWSKDKDHTGLEKLAEEWLEVLKEDGKEPEDDASGAMAMIAEGMEGDAGETEGDAMGDGAMDQRGEKLEAQAAARGKDAKERKEHQETAKEMFGRDTGPSAKDYTDSRLTEKRQPTGKERAAATTVSKWFEKARYIDRVIEEKSSVLPPGRLKGRAAVQAAADRSRGVRTHAEPWRSHRRYSVEDPSLKVGVMVDISGSMSGAMQPMAVTAWTLSEACRRIDATASMVYFGDSVFPVLKPGQHLDQVNVYSAPDGSEDFITAFKATDGALNLLHGSGARLLVVVSDMVHQSHQQAAAKKYFARCKQKGVAVVILPMSGMSGYRSGDHAEQYNGLASVIRPGGDPADVALAIGKAAAQELEKAGNRR